MSVARPIAGERSPFVHLPADHWARLRADTPMTLSAAGLDRLRALGDPVSVTEVERIYLPLARLLAIHIDSATALWSETSEFIGSKAAKVPYVVAVAGSVAVGKSTTARVIRHLLGAWPRPRRVALVTTDGFLWPNAELERRGLMERKGFPESYDRRRLLRFVSDIKSGRRRITAPVYSHQRYDVVPDEVVTLDAPDVVVIEGLNLLQPARRDDPSDRGVVADFLDMRIYLDADEQLLRRWYVERFLTLKSTAFRDPVSPFHGLVGLDDEAAGAVAEDIWERINGANLRENIAPTRARADLVLHKGEDHRIEWVKVRKL